MIVCDLVCVSITVFTAVSFLLAFVYFCDAIVRIHKDNPVITICAMRFDFRHILYPLFRIKVWRKFAVLPADMNDIFRTVSG